MLEIFVFLSAAVVLFYRRKNLYSTTQDPGGANVWVISNRQDNNPITKLIHEMFHARDANRGRLDGRTDIGEIKRDEWQATYKENVVRQQMGLPLREFYRSLDNGETVTPHPPRLLSTIDKNKPIFPFWVPVSW